MATRMSIRAMALLFAAAAGGIRATAATYIWTGAAGTSNWSTISPVGQMNWDLSAGTLLLPAVPASESSTILQFNSATGAVTTQDISTPFLLNQLEFGGSAGAFFVYGNSLEFAGTNTTLADSSATAQTINTAIVLAGTNGQDLQVSGSGSGGSLILGGTISDAGTTGTQSGVDITNSLNVTMTAANTYTGLTTINDASLNIQNTDALQNSTANLITGGVLNLLTAGNNLGGLSGDNSSAVIFSAPGGTATGLLNLGFDNQDTTYSGTFVNNIANPAGAQIGFVKYGTGTFTYNGNVALPESPNFVYVQDGTVVLGSGGMDITSAGNLQGGPQKVAISVATGTTLLINQAFALSSAGYAVVNGSGTITLDGAGTLWNAKTVPQSAAGGIELSTVAAGSTLNVQNSATLNTQFLSMKHAGTVNVTNGGQLTIADSGVFSQGDGIFNIFTGGAVTVNQGTLTSQYITSGLSSTIALSDPAGGAALTLNGAFYAADATDTQTTLNGTISDAAGGPGSIDITNNAMVTMTGANTYTGTTTIKDSTLVVQNANALQNSTANIINSGNLTIETPAVSGSSYTNIGGLSGDSTATVTFSPPTGTKTAYLNFGANGQNTTYSGSFINSEATAGLETAIQKYGTGTFTYNGTAGSAVSPNSLNVQAGEMVLSSGGMTNSAGGYLHTGGRQDIALNVNAGATLLIEKGFQLSSAGYEGINGNATVTVDGAGTVWNADTMTNSFFGGIFISYLLPGSTLNVQNNAILNSQFVSLSGQGEFNITSGAAVTVFDSGPHALSNGGTTLSALGALTINSATLTTQYLNSVATATIAISDPASGTALTINGAFQSANASYTDSTLAGPISDAAGGPGSIDITNNAMVTMTGANTYTGTTTIKGSTLVVQNANALQDSTANIINSGNLAIETPAVSGNSTTNIGGLSGDSTATVIFSPPTGTTLATANIGGDNQNTTYSGTFSNTLASAEAGFYKYGTGTFTYNGRATAALSPNFLAAEAGQIHLTGTGMLNLISTGFTGFGGISTLFADNSGSILIDNGFQVSATGFVSVHGTGVLTVAGSGTVLTNNLTPNSTAGGILIGYAGKTSTMNIQNAAQVYTPYLQVGDAGLTQNPGYGVLNVSSLGMLTVGGSGVFTNGNGQIYLDTGSAINVNAGQIVTDSLNSIAGSTISLTDSPGVSSLRMDGTYAANAANTGSTLSGTIVDGADGSGSLYISNGAMVTMTGANTYTGTTTINGSTLVVQNTNALQNSTANIINSGNLTIETPAVSGGSYTNIGALSGDSSARVTFSPPTGTTLAIINIGGDNQSTTYSGTFSNTLPGAEAGFYKYGTGTFTYNVGATVQSPNFLAAEAGEIHLTGAESLNLISTGFTGFTGISTLFADNSGSILIDNGFHVSATGYVTVHGTGVLTVSGSGTLLRTYLTPNTTDGGILIGYAGKTSTMNIQNAAQVYTPYLQVGDAGFAQNPGYGVLNVSSSGLLMVGELRDANHYPGRIYLDSGSSINVNNGQIETDFINSIAGSTISLTNYPLASGLQLYGTYNPANAANTESIINGTVVDGANGSGSIALGNGALLIMTGANTYTGTTTINDATLVLQNTNALQDSTANIIQSGNLNIETPGNDVSSYTSIGGLSGDSTATVTFSPPAGTTLARTNFGADNQSTTYSGTFINTAAAGGLETQIIKYGTGTWIYNGIGAENGGLNSLYVQQGTAILSSGGMTLTTDGPILLNSPYAISVATASSLLVNDGFTLNTVGYVGISGTGSITLDGKGTTWNATTVPSGIVAGDGGILMSYASPNGGTVNVQNDATLNAQYIGNGDQGVLNITSGASVTINYTGSAPLGNGLLQSLQNGAVNVNAATLTAEFVQFTGNGDLTISDPVGGTALTINGAYDPTNATSTESIFNGTIADGAGGPGSIAIKNNAMVIFGGVLNYTGTTAISGNSTVDVTGATANSREYMVSGNSSLTFSGTTVNLGSTGSISVDQGSSVAFTTPITVNGGTLSGAGILNVSAGGTTFNQSTISADTTLSDNATGVVTFQSFTANGTVNVNSGTADFTNGSIGTTAVLTDGAIVDVSGLEIDGQVNVAAGGSFANSGTDLQVTSTATFMVNQSAAATIAPGTQMQLTGTLVNNGTITGAVTAGNGGHVSGSGSFDTLTLNSGSIFSPGNSPGSATITTAVWNSGSTYLWQINSPGQSGGSTGGNPGWDYVKIQNLTLPSSGRPVTIMIDSQTLGAIPADGPLAGFNASQKYSWLIATSGNSAFGSLSSFSLDSSEFVTANNLNVADSSAFSLSSADGMNLYLNYAPVQTPEPAALGLFVGGAALLLLRKKRGNGRGRQSSMAA